MSRPYDLASINALVAFEAAARHGSFKMAAQELNVTPAAISHQVKALEVNLVCQLFLRQQRGVELTEKGQALFLTLQKSFEAISERVMLTRERPDAVDVTISVTTAVSALWLTPRITQFWRTYPHVTVSQIVTDVPGSIWRTDLSILYGDNPSGNSEGRELFRDRILALGAPGFAAEHGIACLDDLIRAPLVHSSIDEAGWTGWEDWFAMFGLAAPMGKRLSVNNDMIALQAAQDGVGAVLGWEGLVGGLIDSGRLVPLVDEHVPSPHPFILCIHRQANPKARLFADWLTGRG